jgi:hypothetical protein
MSDARTFQTNTEAFEHACDHLDCSLKDGRAVLAVVLAVHGRMCSVKIANREDKTIPAGTLNELLARTDLVPHVEPGDLVLYATMPELAAAGKQTVAGTIVARVNPHYTPKGGWQARSAEWRSEASSAVPDGTVGTP